MLNPTLIEAISELAQQHNLHHSEDLDELTVVVPRELLIEVSTILRDSEKFAFDTLIDVCGVDYSDYGVVDWTANSATNTGFSRACHAQKVTTKQEFEQRFAVVYHLLSTTLNHRIRLRVFVADADMQVPSVCSLWPAANWFEREAFDLFGVVFAGHPDLRRILTDYGFKGHPFRKDFPLIGEVEMRYDATKQRCVYEPVSIQPRILVPRVIRNDKRYSPEIRENA